MGADGVLLVVIVLSVKTLKLRNSVKRLSPVLISAEDFWCSPLHQRSLLQSLQEYLHEINKRIALLLTRTLYR